MKSLFTGSPGDAVLPHPLPGDQWPPDPRCVFANRVRDSQNEQYVPSNLLKCRKFIGIGARGNPLFFKKGSLGYRFMNAFDPCTVQETLP